MSNSAPIKVKFDIGTSVSVELVVGYAPDKSPQHQVVAFLPGAILPPNLSPVIVKKLQDGDPHISSLLEFDRTLSKDEIPDAIQAGPTVFGHEVAVPPLANPFQMPVGNGEQPVSGLPPVVEGTEAAWPFLPPPSGTDYDEWKRLQLDEEVEKRRNDGRTIEIEGTGAGGNIKSEDIVKSLKADDAAADAEGLAAAQANQS